MTEPPRLKIGISAFFQYSFFSNGIATTMWSLADALARFGHKISLINVNENSEWYEDCKDLKNVYERRNLIKWDELKYEKLDLFIDIDGFILPNVRRKIANRVVAFIRKPTALNEIEHTVYPLAGPVRNIRDVDAVWTWEHFGSQDAHILGLLSEKTVHRIPFTWSPRPVVEYGKEHPTWQQITETQPTDNWACHITEMNQSMTANCTLPIVIMAYTKKHSKVPLKKYYVHNANTIKEQKFFEDNILNHCKCEDLEAEFIGRQRITDWRVQPKSFVLSHNRFTPLKTMLLDCVWNGIPLVHNSPWLRKFGNGLERYYYSDNSVKEAKKAIETMADDFEKKVGIFAPGALQQIQINLLKYMDITPHIGTWVAAFLGASSGASPAPAPYPAPTTTALTETVAKKSDEIVVGFSDLWQSANHEYNFWTLMLQEACNKLQPPKKVRGVKITDSNLNEKIDVLFFNPAFGDVWTRVAASVPKVHITGENTKSVSGNGVYLNLGFEPTDKEKGIYRFPLWTQYIDWFGADQDKLENPRSMPIDVAAKVDKDMLDKKQKFCAFIVSNPGNQARNDAFHWLSGYKHVDSAGRLFNNIGDCIFSNNGGGGGGELKKLEFLKDYKFCLTYENSKGEGYITEKFLAAKAAGCVPIYWGDMNVTRDFPEGSFIDANNLDSAEKLIEAVRKMDENPEIWKSAAEKAAIDVDKERRRLAEVATLILKPIIGDAVNQLPVRLGAASTAEARTMGLIREGDKKLASPLKVYEWNGKTLLVTFASQRFVQSLAHWLAGAELRTKADSNVSMRVYLADDVEDQMMNTIKSQYPLVDFRRIPSKTLTNPTFPDMWEPQHFAWKLWIYQELVQESALQNTLIWYMDAGSMIVRWPDAWLQKAVDNGICMLEDREQKNEQWCHMEFCARLSVTAEEKAAQQVVGGIMAFVGGARLPWKVFTEAWVYGQQRGIIVGPKWSGVLPDGRPYGHRHDQSILSILRLRHKVPVEPLETVYNHESMRRTFKSGAALYVHRGVLKEHEDFAPRIGEVHIINLARRADRIKRFKENHEAWTKLVCLSPAYDGKQIKMTPSIAKLFAPNDFFWKKAVLGCAMSHLSLWIQLANEKPVCENYLILEDDVKFQKGWLEIWNKAAKDIPEDYDVLYLGGVLPPNREMFKTLLEPVNDNWSRIKENKIFNQSEPTRYFHFCNYSYILSRKGAQKIIEGMQRHGGYYTSADHMICNRVEDMKHYVLNPQVAGCYQDDDPKYAGSSFNDFSRVDNFDSDLWNNDERFTEKEVIEALSLCKDPAELPIGKAFEDARGALVAKKEPTRFYEIGEIVVNPDALLEYKWLRELFGPEIDTRDVVPVDHVPLENKPIFICMKPTLKKYLPVFERYEAAGREFIVLHLSDEYCDDPVDFYKFKSCKAIIRPYPSKTAPAQEKIIYIPLGPYRQAKGVDSSSQRPYIWSFYGTNWRDRKKLLEPLMSIEPNKHGFFDEWMDKKQISEDEYSQICRESYFIPVPRGQNVETFRFWEALECGAIPLYVRSEGDEEYFKFISSKLPVLSIDAWDKAADFVKSLMSNTNTLTHYRTTMQQRWASWKTELQGKIKEVTSDK
jgi:GR25 family glycosyltransferase involved in LPS biosynthesis